MLASLVVTTREGLEAALILGILSTYLGRSGHRPLLSSLWTGAAFAFAGSLVLAAALFALSMELSGRAEELFEGSTMFFSVGVLTYMLLWMRGQGPHLRGELQTRVEAALG